MKIVVLGGGVAGLTAAYYLTKKGRAVTLLEKEAVLGGLAAGFREAGWDWYLEKHYHHFFSNDADILKLTTEIGFDGIFFQKPLSASLYYLADDRHQYPNLKLTQIPVSSAGDLLRFPILTLSENLRVAAVAAFLKLSPFLKLYERQTAEVFLRKTMGEKAWVALWRPLFRKKFGKYAGNILASFIWSRIKKRTRTLGYIRGGFQSLIDHLEQTNQRLGAVIKKNCSVETIERKERGFVVNGEPFDAVISTLPTPVLTKIARRLLPTSYLKRLAAIKYLHAVNLILATSAAVFRKFYWLNVMIKDFPFVAAVAQTNFIDKKHYGGRHLLYLGNYVEDSDRLWQMNKDEVLTDFMPHLKKINPKIDQLIVNSYLFRGPFAQPVFDQAFLQNKPDFKTPVANFYIANLDMTYPHDRGTNYAVKLGREAATLI